MYSLRLFAAPVAKYVHYTQQTSSVSTDSNNGSVSTDSNNGSVSNGMRVITSGFRVRSTVQCGTFCSLLECSSFTYTADRECLLLLDDDDDDDDDGDDGSSSYGGDSGDSDSDDDNLEYVSMGYTIVSSG